MFPKNINLKGGGGALKFSYYRTLYRCCWSGHKKGANRTIKVKMPLGEQRNMLGTRKKIMWEKQLVDLPIHYITSVIAL